MENLDKLTELRCLYLSKNLIKRIEGLNSLTNLIILDLSYNHLTMLENLSCCPSLQTLNVSHNSLSTLESIEHLKECHSLNTLDLTNNRLEANEQFLELFTQIPALVALSVNGNEITKLSTFRKRMIAGMPKLGYLDRPIEEQEKLFAQAFITGGTDAETQARNEWKEKQHQKRVDEMNEFRRWQQEQQALRKQAKAEGREGPHHIREFTPEEQEERRKEAEKAAQEEKDLLAMGIDKIAAKYWTLDSSDKHKNKDILEIASSQLRADKEKAAARAASYDREEEEKEEPRVVELTDEEVQEEEIGSTAATAISSLPSPPKQQQQSFTKIAIDEEEEDSDDEEEKEEQQSVTLPPPPPTVVEETEEEKQQKREAEIAQQKEKERLLQEEKEQLEREQRVQDSFAIYKRQLEAKKKSQNSDESDLPASRGYSYSNTWHSAAATSTTDAQTNSPFKPLYWSEAMDLELAKQVKANIYDFEAISHCMIDMARKRKLDNVDVHRRPDLLTNEVCRLRWAELDANNWCVPAPGTTAADTLFRVNLTDDILQQTGGAQPSYEALSRMALNSKPNYLKVPTAFPSVHDDAGKEDEDLNQLD
jgi:dynein assembly factor 1